MKIELTAFELLALPESTPIKQAFYRQEAKRAELSIDFQSERLKAMGGLAVFCAMGEVELGEAA